MSTQQPRIREICTLVERLCGATPAQLREAAPDISAKAISVYCTRAVDYGMLTRERCPNGSGRSYKYFAVPRWQDIDDEPVPTAAQRGIYPNGPRPLASVWELGSRVPATLAGVWA